MKKAVFYPVEITRHNVVEFRGEGENEYEAHHAAAMAIHDMIVMLTLHYDKALENASNALDKDSWDQPST